VGQRSLLFATVALVAFATLLDYIRDHERSSFSCQRNNEEARSTSACSLISISSGPARLSCATALGLEILLAFSLRQSSKQIFDSRSKVAANWRPRGNGARNGEVEVSEVSEVEVDAEVDAVADRDRQRNRNRNRNSLGQRNRIEIGAGPALCNGQPRAVQRQQLAMGTGALRAGKVPIPLERPVGVGGLGIGIGIGIGLPLSSPKGQLDDEEEEQDGHFEEAILRQNDDLHNQQVEGHHQEESIDSLHGLRFLSMIWVIVIHSYNFALRWMYFSNSDSLGSIYKSLGSQLLANGSFACDSFFFVGGFLLPYLAFRGPAGCESVAVGQTPERRRRGRAKVGAKEHAANEEEEEEEHEEEERRQKEEQDGRRAKEEGEAQKSGEFVVGEQCCAGRQLAELHSDVDLDLDLDLDRKDGEKKAKAKAKAKEAAEQWGSLNRPVGGCCARHLSKRHERLACAALAPRRPLDQEQNTNEPPALADILLCCSQLSGSTKQNNNNNNNNHENENQNNHIAPANKTNFNNKRACSLAITNTSYQSDESLFLPLTKNNSSLLLFEQPGQLNERPEHTTEKTINNNNNNHHYNNNNNNNNQTIAYNASQDQKQLLIQCKVRKLHPVEGRANTFQDQQLAEHSSRGSPNAGFVQKQPPCAMTKGTLSANLSLNHHHHHHSSSLHFAPINKAAPSCRAKKSQDDNNSSKFNHNNHKAAVHNFTLKRALANVVHRYVRMMPLMMSIIGLSATLLRHLGDQQSAQWNESTMMFDQWCRKNWWVNAMFLHNFINRENMCLSHSWYSAVDLQLFLLGQVLLLALSKSRRLGLTLLLGLLFGSQLLNGFLTVWLQLPAVPLVSNVSETTMNLYYGQIYIKPYCRASPYLIGILFAYLMRTTSLANYRLQKVSFTGDWPLYCL